MSVDERGADAAQAQAAPVMLGLDASRLVPALVAVSAFAALFAGEQPTGTGWVDLVLAASFAGAVPAMASRAGAQGTLIAASLAIILSGLQNPSFALAFGGAALALSMTTRRPFDAPSAAIVSAASAAMTTHAALRLPNVRWVGTASLFAAIVIAPIIYAFWKQAPTSTRKRIVRGGRIAGIFTTIAAILAVIAGLAALGRVVDAIDSVEVGIDALQDGRQAEATAALDGATADFAETERLLGGPLNWPARLVPILAQHSRAFEVAAAEGRNLSAAASATLTTADVEQIRGSNGAIDLALVDRVNTELTSVNTTLTDAQSSISDVRSPWLLPVVDDRLEDVGAELDELHGDIELANHAVSALPGLLGGEGPRTYLVLFIQPAESREYGGLVGAYGLLRAVDGQLSLIESGSVDDGTWDGEAEFSNPGVIPEPYFVKSPHRHPQNLTMIADLATIAEAAADLAPQWRDEPDLRIDGVMTIDPFGLAALLELTGPILLPGRVEPITADNVVSYLLREQYLDDTVENEDRREGLRELAGASFARLFSIDVPGPERLGEIFGPLARQNRIAFHSFDEFENAFLRQVLLDADLPRIGNGVSMIGVFHSTGVAGKLDAYTQRHMEYHVTLDPETRTTSGELAVTMRNDVPPDAPEYVRGLAGDGIGEAEWQTGTNHAVLDIYTRDQLGTVAADTEFVTSTIRRSLTYAQQTIAVLVPEASERTVTIPMTGTMAFDRFDLLLAAQPTALPATFRVRVSVPAGWQVSTEDGSQSGDFVVVEGELSHHRPISVLVTAR